MMALEWCRRRQHFYDIWKEAGDNEHEYTDEEIASYPDNLGWVEWLIARGMQPVCWQRAHEVQASVPARAPIRGKAA